jgi:ribulose 1,5-bisphosphate synthetase/thiazole synthase
LEDFYEKLPGNVKADYLVVGGGPSGLIVREQRSTEKQER